MKVLGMVIALVLVVAPKLFAGVMSPDEAFAALKKNTRALVLIKAYKLAHGIPDGQLRFERIDSEYSELGTTTKIESSTRDVYYEDTCMITETTVVDMIRTKPDGMTVRIPLRDERSREYKNRKC